MAFPALVGKRTHGHFVTHKAARCLKCTVSIVRQRTQARLQETCSSLNKASNFHWPHLHTLSRHVAHVCGIDANLHPRLQTALLLAKPQLLPHPLPEDSSKKGGT